MQMIKSYINVYGTVKLFYAIVLSLVNFGIFEENSTQPKLLVMYGPLQSKTCEWKRHNIEFEYNVGNF